MGTAEMQSPFSSSRMYFRAKWSRSLVKSQNFRTERKCTQTLFYLWAPMFIAAQFTIAKCWKQPKCLSVHEWIKELWYIYTMEYYIAERKKDLLPFATVWMELKSILLSEVSLEVKDKYHIISPISGT